MSILQIIGAAIALGGAALNFIDPAGGSFESSLAMLLAFVFGAALWGVSFLVD